MKATFTLSMSWLHTWGGLVVGWVLFAVVFTGTLAVFHHEIEEWMRPELHAEEMSAARGLRVAETYLKHNAPKARSWSIALPEDGLVTVRSGGGRRAKSAVLNADGEVVTSRDTAGGEFLAGLHANFRSRGFGTWVVIACGLFMLGAIVSGIVVHKRIFRDFFTFRPGKGQRSWLDGHNLVGVATLPFQIVIAASGVLINPVSIMPAAVETAFKGDDGAYFDSIYWGPYRREAAHRPAAALPLPELVARGEALLETPVESLQISHPGDANSVVTLHGDLESRLTKMDRWVSLDAVTGRLLDGQLDYSGATTTSGVIVGLHLGTFGGAGVRWLYLLLGMASSAMVATGLVLFIAKREPRHAGKDQAWFVKAAARINVFACAGLIVACAALFWTNRLLPLDLQDRAALEGRIFFWVWVVCMLHAVVRPPRRAWTEQLAVTAALCLALPVLNVATTGAWFATYAMHGDVVRAVVELTVMIAGGLLGWLAWRVGRAGKQAPASKARPRVAVGEA